MNFLEFCLCIVMITHWIQPAAFPYAIEVASVLMLTNIIHRRWR